MAVRFCGSGRLSVLCVGPVVGLAGGRSVPPDSSKRPLKTECRHWISMPLQPDLCKSGSWNEGRLRRIHRPLAWPSDVRPLLLLATRSIYVRHRPSVVRRERLPNDRLIADAERKQIDRSAQLLECIPAGGPAGADGPQVKGILIVLLTTLGRKLVLPEGFAQEVNKEAHPGRNEPT